MKLKNNIKSKRTKALLITSIFGVAVTTTNTIKAAAEILNPQVVPRNQNVQSTEAYQKSLVFANLRINVDKDTGKIHFIRDNNDPYVITKAYVLKNADAYEVRPYLRSIVAGRRVSQSETGVEAIKYNDGTSIVLVSAEQYRFKSNQYGMGIDEIIAKLDQQKITSSSGSVSYFYFPMYRDARELQEMVENVGANINGDALELIEGGDKLTVEPGLNALYVFSTRYNRKNIARMLKKYDVPLPMARIKYTVYELYSENDGKIGADFQAWKNNEGADLFQAGLRYRDNWSATWNRGIEPSGSNKTSFLNFNPKWNTRYLDFLVAKSKGRVITRGALTIRNREPGVIENKTNIFNVERSDEKAGSGDTPYGEVQIANNYTVGGDEYKLTAFDSNGKKIAIAGTNGAEADLVVLRNPISNSKTNYRYTLLLENINGNIYFTRGGDQVGTDINAYSYRLKEKNDDGDYVTVTDWNEDQAFIGERNSKFFTTPAKDGYGFKLEFNAQINQKATIIDVDLVMDSLIGWDSDGTPRIAKTSETHTQVQISAQQNRFVLGGIKKKSVVRSVSGVPYLRKLPGLGWIFGSESESTKTSQIVVVAECENVLPSNEIKSRVRKRIKSVTDATSDAGGDNKYGFGQYIIDEKIDFGKKEDNKKK